jgi:hypothetical protein
MDDKTKNEFNQLFVVNAQHGVKKPNNLSVWKGMEWLWEV